MKLYNKVNKYILERYPLLWNTHFVWLILIGLATHLMFFVFGYLILDFEVLKQYSVSNQFFKEVVFYLYIIILLISIIYFGFRYFNHNPFKNFYPLTKGYFLKIFGLLISILFVFSTVIVSFENGMIYKANKIVPRDKLIEEAKIVNLAYPFLFTELSAYHITNRCYPKPFPLEELSHFEIGYDTVNHESILHRIDYKQPYLSLNGNEYQFGNIISKEVNCATSSEIEKIIDVKKVYELHEYSIYNFNKIFIGQVLDSSLYYDSIVVKVHNIFRSNEKNEIIQILSNFMNICDRYEIKYKLNPSKMTEEIFSQDLDKKQLIKTGLYDYTEKDRTSQAFAVMAHKTHEDNSEEVTFIDSATVTEAAARNSANSFHEKVECNYSVDLQKYANIVTNMNELNSSMGYHYLTPSNLIALILVSFFIALLLILVKYIPLKNILIGLVVFGILATLVGFIIFIYTLGHYNNIEVPTMSILIFCMMTIIVIGTQKIYSNKSSKTMVANLFLSIVVASQSILPLSLMLIREITKIQFNVPCQGIKTDYLFEFEIEYFLILELISVMFLFMLLKRLHAKAE